MEHAVACGIFGNRQYLAVQIDGGIFGDDDGGGQIDVSAQGDLAAQFQGGHQLLQRIGGAGDFFHRPEAVFFSGEVAFRHKIGYRVFGGAGIRVIALEGAALDQNGASGAVMLVQRPFRRMADKGAAVDLHDAAVLGINQIVMIVAAGAFVGKGAAIDDDLAAVGPDGHTVIVLAQTVHGALTVDGQGAGGDMEHAVACGIFGNRQCLAVQIQRYILGDDNCSGEIHIRKHHNIAADGCRFFQRNIIGIADHSYCSAIEAAVIADVAAFQIAAVFVKGIAAAASAGMGAVIAGNIGIIVGMDGNLFFFHNEIPFCIHRHIGGDRHAGRKTFAGGCVPTGKGIAGTGGSSDGADALTFCYGYCRIGALAAVIIQEGNGIGGQLNLRLGFNRLGLFFVSVQDDSQFSAVGAALRGQIAADAVDDACGAGPLHGRNSPLADLRSVGVGLKIHAFAHADIKTLQLHITIQHGYQLLARNVAVGVGAVGHSGGDCPLLSGQIPGVAAGGTDTFHAGQCGPNHCAADFAVGLEGAITNTVHQVVFVDIGNFTGEPVVGCHIGNGARCREGRGGQGKGQTYGQQNGKNSMFHCVFLISSSSCCVYYEEPRLWEEVEEYPRPLDYCFGSLFINADGAVPDALFAQQGIQHFGFMSTGALFFNLQTGFGLVHVPGFVGDIGSQSGTGQSGVVDIAHRLGCVRIGVSQCIGNFFFSSLDAAGQILGDKGVLFRGNDLQLQHGRLNVAFQIQGGVAIPELTVVDKTHTAQAGGQEPGGAVEGAVYQLEILDAPLQRGFIDLLMTQSRPGLFHGLGIDDILAGLLVMGDVEGQISSNLFQREPVAGNGFGYFKGYGLHFAVGGFGYVQLTGEYGGGKHEYGQKCNKEISHVNSPFFNVFQWVSSVASITSCLGTAHCRTDTAKDVLFFVDHCKGSQKAPGYSYSVPNTLLSATGCHALAGLGPIALRHSFSTALPLSFASWKRSVLRRSDKDILFCMVCLRIKLDTCTHNITPWLFFVNTISKFKYL